MMNKYHNKNNFMSLSVMSLFLAGISLSAMADDYYPASLFNIPGTDSQLTNEDIDVFKDNDNAPGKYKVTLIINNNKIAVKEIDFVLKKTTPVMKNSSPAYHGKNGKMQDWISRYQITMIPMAALISMALNIRMAISILIQRSMH